MLVNMIIGWIVMSPVGYVLIKGMTLDISIGMEYVLMFIWTFCAMMILSIVIDNLY